MSPLRLIPYPPSFSFTVGFVSATRFPVPKQSVYAPAAPCQDYDQFGGRFMNYVLCGDFRQAENYPEVAEDRFGSESSRSTLKQLKILFAHLDVDLNGSF
jgi:hypothetical protein